MRSNNDNSSESGDSTCGEDDDFASSGEWGLTDSDNQTTASCLFCTDSFADAAEVFVHLKTNHDFNIYKLRNKHGMDQLSYIQLINYVRERTAETEHHKKKSEELVKSLMACAAPEWTAEKYLQPVLEDDHLLMHWFEDDSGDNGNDEQITQESTGTSTSDNNGIQETVIASSLSVRNRVLERQLANFEGKVQELLEQVNSMRDVMNRLVLDDGENKNMVTNAVKKALAYDVNYFESYDDVHIHDVMIFDSPRTEGYKLAIIHNSKDFNEKVVLDVGCGTGILSMFAAKAGAKKVFAVDHSRIIEKAVDIVRGNGFGNTIEFIRGKVENIALPVNGVDIIISEFMGYFLLYEGMLLSYLEARDKFLRPGGLLFPNQAELYIFGSNDAEYENYFNRWENVHGFNMSVLKPDGTNPLLECVPADKVGTNSVRVVQLDLQTCDYDQASFQSTFHLTASKDCRISAICGYFDVGFTAGSSYTHTLTTGPLGPPTHWYQTIFPLRGAISVQQGDEIDGQIECRPSVKNPRSIDIRLVVDNHEYTYTMA